MVPEGWRKRSLEDIAKIQTGVAKGKRNIVNPVMKPYLRVANVQDGYLDLGEIKEIEVAAKDVERYRLEHGDVVLTEGGDFDKLGRGTLWRGQIDGCLHQNHVFAVRVDRSKILPEFFSAQTNSFYGKAYFLSCAKRSTNLASINSTQLKQFPALVPPLPEQRKIADILSMWDRAIEKTASLLANAQTQKRALMQSLLTGKRRFPAFEGQPWKEVRLGDMLDMEYGKSPKEVRDDEGDVPIIGTGGITGYAREGFAEGPSIVIGRKGTIDAPQWIEGSFWPIDTTYYCHTNSETSLRWLFYVLSHMNLRKYNEASGVPSLSRETLRSIRIPLPSLNEQRLIARTIGNEEVFEEIHRRSGLKLRTEKKALMQQLLTGKRRVVV